MKNPLLVLVSGGRSSAFMARHIQTSEKYKDYTKLFVFCNTGQERPETIEFLRDMVKHWDLPLNLIEGVYSKKAGVGVKHKVVDFESLDMNNGPYTGAIMHYNKHKWVGVPCDPAPYCSHYLKVLPSHSFAKKIFGTTKYIKAIGYRIEDMPKRITFAELRADTKIIAPNITDFDAPISNLDLNRFFDNIPFKLQIHNDLGNCEICWKKSDKSLIRNIQYGVRSTEWAHRMETMYNNTFYRERRSIRDFEALAKSGKQLDMFDDEGGKCVCNFS